MAYISSVPKPTVKITATLTKMERSRLTKLAREDGFRTTADWIYAKALARFAEQDKRETPAAPAPVVASQN